MFSTNLAQSLWLFWNICWHSLWVFAGAIAATGIFHFFFETSTLKTNSLLSGFQKDFSKITFPLLVVILFLFRFFGPTLSSIFILATLLLRVLLWFYELLRHSLKDTKKQLTSTFLAHKPSLKSNYKKKLFSLQSWKDMGSKQIKSFKQAKTGYLGGLFLVFLIGLLPASILTRFISYSPNFILAFFQNTLFGLTLGLILPFSYLAKLPLAIYLADLGFSFAGIFSFLSVSLILAWLKSFSKNYSLKQTGVFTGYLLLGFLVISFVSQLLYILLPWQKPLRVALLDQGIAFNLDFFLNCLSIFGAIIILITARSDKKLDFFNQINKIIAKIKKPRR